MGAGKSTVGSALAQRLNWIFEDLDDRIIRRERRPIADIFRESGETAFRRAEHQALLEVVDELRSGSARVVALGGGAFVQKHNADLLRGARVPTVFLDAPAEELWRRCCEQATQRGTERPLLNDRKQFRELYRSRLKAYRGASVRLPTKGRAVDEIAAEVEQTLGLTRLSIRTEQGEVE